VSIVLAKMAREIRKNHTKGECEMIEQNDQRKESRWEVSIWKQFLGKEGTGWCYKSFYYGDSLLKACWMMIKAKRLSTCVKLEWR